MHIGIYFIKSTIRCNFLLPPTTRNVDCKCIVIFYNNGFDQLIPRKMSPKAS